MGNTVGIISSEQQSESVGTWSFVAPSLHSRADIEADIEESALSLDIKYALGGTAQDNEYLWSSFQLDDIELDSELEIAGYIASAEGKVELTRAGQASVLRANDVVLAGDVISSGDGSKLLIQFIDKTELRLGSDSELSIDGFSYEIGNASNRQALSLYQGSFSYSSGMISKQDSSYVDFSTPYGSLVLREAILLGKVSASDGALYVTTLDGRVSLRQGSLELAGVSGLFRTLVVTHDGVDRSFVLRTETVADILSRYDFLDGKLAELQDIHPNIPLGIGGSTSDGDNSQAFLSDASAVLPASEATSAFSFSAFSFSALSFSALGFSVLSFSAGVAQNLRFASSYSFLDEYFPSSDGLVARGAGAEIFSSTSVELLAAYSFRNGGLGNDAIFGDIFTDIIRGYSGNDQLHGGAGSDYLYGGIGNDHLYGDSGLDELYGGDGIDELYGGADSDSLFGGAGADHLYGGGGVDHLYGGLDNDVLRGESGNDELHGGGGNDVLLGGIGNDELYGELGIDTLDGGGGNDVLRGGENDDELYGGAGRDELYGEGGNDVLRGGDNDDDLYGGENDDDLYGGAGRDDLYGGEGADELYGEGDNDVLRGGESDDELYGGAGADELYGDAGADELYGEGGNDVLRGGVGEDELYGGAGRNELYGGADADDYFFYADDYSALIVDSGGGDIKFISSFVHSFVGADFVFTRGDDDLTIAFAVNGFSQSVTISDYYLLSTSYSISYEDTVGTAYALAP